MSDKDSATPRVYLIRHGETEWSRSGRYTGITDLELLPDGEDRVRQTAAVVLGKNKLIDLDKVAKVFCSPRKRATKTLEILLGTTSIEDSRILITEDIAEWGYGDYEGLKTHQILELRKSQGRDQDRKWDIWRDGAEGPMSETPDQVTARLDDIISQITLLHSRYLADSKSGSLDPWKGQRDILVIAHGHILRAFVKRWLGFSLATHIELMLEPGGVCGLSYAHSNVEERAILAGMSFPQA